MVKASSLSNNNSKNLGTYNSLSPIIGVYLKNGSFGAVGLLLSYQYVNYVFDLNEINLNPVLTTPYQNYDRISWFSIGFAYEKTFGSN